MIIQRHHDSADGSADDPAGGTRIDSCRRAHANVGTIDPATDPAPRDGVTAGACGTQGEGESAPVSSERLEAFSDGVITIAITLLSLEIKLPDGGGSLLHSLGSLWPSYLGFILSFLLVGQVWLNHHTVFVRMRSVDQWMLICNLFLLLDVAFLPFVTSVLTRSLESDHDERTGAIFYEMIIVVGGLFFNTLWWASIRDHGRLRAGVSEAEVCFVTWRLATGPWLYSLVAPLGIVSAWLSVVTYVALIVFYMVGHRLRRISPTGS